MRKNKFSILAFLLFLGLAQNLNAEMVYNVSPQTGDKQGCKAVDPSNNPQPSTGKCTISFICKNGKVESCSQVNITTNQSIQCPDSFNPCTKKADGAYPRNGQTLSAQSCGSDSSYSLTLAVTPSGKGAIEYRGKTCPGGNPDDCKPNFFKGDVVSLSAKVIDNSYKFDLWSGACTGNGPCSVTMDGIKSVTATFVPTSPSTYLLTVEKTGSGSGTVVSTSPNNNLNCGSACSIAFASGTQVSLKSTAGASSTFAGWSGACSGTGSTCTVAMNQVQNVKATFNAVPSSDYTLTVSKSGVGSGTVKSTSPDGTINCGSTCSNTYTNGTTVQLQPTASAGSVFAEWSGACTGSASTCTVTMTQSRSVTAKFNTATPSNYTLTLTKSGNGSGTVSSNPSGISCGTDCSQSYTAGTVVNISALAASGSTFDGWSGSGCMGIASCNVTMSSDKTVTADFDLPPATPTLTVTKAGTGASVGVVTSTNPTGISCGSTCAKNFSAGATVILSAAANGTTFVGWSGACTGTDTTCNVSMGSTNKSVTATFNSGGGGSSYTVSVSKSGSGTVTSTPSGINCGSTCSKAYVAGTNVTLVATPASGSVFSNWTGQCSGGGQCLLSNLSANKSVGATFTVSGGGGGGGGGGDGGCGTLNANCCASNPTCYVGLYCAYNKCNACIVTGNTCTASIQCCGQYCNMQTGKCQ